MDTYGWVEYSRGSRKGETVKKIIQDNKNKIITIECCVAELKTYCLRNELDFNRMFKLIKTNSYTFPVLIDTWLDAAKTKFELRKKIQNIGLIDAILVAKQKELGGKIVSGDSHFKTLKNIVYLGD